MVANNAAGSSLVGVGGNDGREGQRVRFGDAVIEYRVQRSQRRKKTIQISVSAAGVVVAAPAPTTAREVEELVLRRAGWILRRLAESRPTPEPLRFSSGEILPYRGCRVELAVEPVESTGSGRAEVQLDGSRLRVAVPRLAAGAAGREQVGKTVTAWYWRRTEEQVREGVRRWWPALKPGKGWGDYPRVVVRNQRRRWGSCARDGVLRFNWRLSMLEPSLTEYVVVHELAHRTHMNHSADFWNLVARHLPDVKERRQELKEAEATLPPL